MLTENFRDSLERKLTHALWNAQEKEWKAYWCDGVLEPETDDLIDSEDGQRAIKTIAFLPKGQYHDPEYRFELFIWLGPQSEKAYKEDFLSERHIPDGEAESWIFLDIPARRIEVQLH